MRKRTGGTRRTLPQTLRSDWGTAGAARHALRTKRRASKRPFRRLTLRAAHVESTLWLLVGLVLVVSLWASPRMQPRTLVIEGAPPAAHHEIEMLLRSLWREPYGIRISAGALEAELVRLGWVAQVQVLPRLPAQLRLHLQPREPFVEVRTPTNRRLFIDPAGITFLPPNPPHSVPGGVIRLPEGYAIPFEIVADSPVGRAFQLLHALNRRSAFGTRHLAWQVELTPGGELNLFCRAEGGAAMRFHLGDAFEWQQQVEVILQLLDSPLSGWADWEYIDLKSPSHPAVKRLAQRSE
jgi:hypothetical protein